MNTILLIPTGEGVGLTSACLGMIYALDCNGIKAGFLKPFSQKTKSILTEPLHYLVIYFKVKPFNLFRMKS
jgi:BioD-like phosphotransacetylase family protein